MEDWHPLQKHIRNVLFLYMAQLDEDLALHRITLDEYTEKMNECNFNSMLDYLKYRQEVSAIAHINSALEVFEPLHIHCYGEFVLFRYKDADSKLWEMYDGLYRECRSCVFSTANGDLVIAPQQKFHNVNEIDGWMEADVRQKLDEAVIVNISDKMDGSNQNARYYNGKIILAGSQSMNPEESWRVKKGYELLTPNHIKMLKANPDWTFMFEHISQEDVHVVHYNKEQEGLYLFGIRIVKSGFEFPFEDVQNIAKKYGVPCPELCATSFDEILNTLDDYKSSEKEGWVISMMNNSLETFKVKIKTTDYVLMHNAFSKLVSPNAIIQAIAEDKFDDFYSKVPLSHREYVDAIAEQVRKYINYAQTYILDMLRAGHWYAAEFEPEEQRKAFFQWVNENVKKEFRGLVGACYDRKTIHVLKKNDNGYKKLGELVVPDV